MNPIFIETATSFDANAHLYPPEYEGHFDSLMIAAKDIRVRIAELAALIHSEYQDKRPVLVCTLKGACPFFQHLQDALIQLRQGFDIEFIRASSYAGTESSGVVSMMGELRLETLQNRHVLIIEDIVDTGTTLQTILPTMNERGKPTSVEVCTLLDKRLGDRHTKKITAKYIGFSIPDFFIIGYGLDYNELYRDLQDIFVISKEGIAFDAQKELYMTK